jgi:regulation of enolase protein 1 (concanavalin A-like superfamily)
LLTDAPDGDFALTAEVTVNFRNSFDAGGLFLRNDRSTWARLGLEFSPDRKAKVVNVVSVVTDVVSDKAIAFTVKTNIIHLRISRQGAVYAFHTSPDGFRWLLVRTFALPGAHEAFEVGFEAHSPHGDGCDVSFDIPTLTSTSLADLRDGS